MELPPAASPSAPLCRRGPRTVADDGQSGAVNDEVQAGARAGAPTREGEMLTASRERGVIGCREINAQHPEDRCQDALGLTQRSVEEETERQGGFDGEIGRLELPAPPADASCCPRGDRVRREPEGDVASPHEGSVVLGPVPDAILCLVRRMHSRLHIEIMPRRRSRWSTCRPLLAHRAESAHQRQVPKPPPKILEVVGEHAQRQPDRIGPEPVTRQPRPMRRLLAFFDLWLSGPALVVKPHDRAILDLEMGHDETDAWEQLHRRGARLSPRPVGPIGSAQAFMGKPTRLAVRESRPPPFSSLVLEKIWISPEKSCPWFLSL